VDRNGLAAGGRQQALPPTVVEKEANKPARDGGTESQGDAAAPAACGGSEVAKGAPRRPPAPPGRGAILSPCWCRSEHVDGDEPPPLERVWADEESARLCAYHTGDMGDGEDKSIMCSMCHAAQKRQLMTELLENRRVSQSA